MQNTGKKSVKYQFWLAAHSPC